MRTVEFWPDYGGALLHEDGQRLTLDALELPGELRVALGEWLGEYDDAKLEPATRDQAWIGTGQELFDQLRAVLRPAGIELIDWEGYWDRSTPDAGGG
jgi:hypothetical protein